MPVPYMGSKRKSASRISNVIEAYCPYNAKILVELFTGWFAVWEEFVKKWYKIIANDKNKYVIALLQKVIKEKLDEEKCLEWVSSLKFKDILKNPDKYDPWYVWYVGIIWSFGNNNKGYLFWQEMENKKRSLYDLVVNKKIDEFIEKNIPKKYIDWILRQSDWHSRRMALKKVLCGLKKRWDLESSLQSLERLERLQSLQSLQSLEKNVEFLSSSYEEVVIPNNAIVYCDPPYQWTAEYSEGNFNHSKFWEYIRKISKTNKVFTSEYTAPADFKCIYEFSQKSSLAWGFQSHNNQPNEKLFIFMN